MFHFFFYLSLDYLYFFFQAEDGIRDGHVTGVQTCALPISDWEEWKPWLLIGIVVGGTLLVAFIIVLAWLEARGNFIFTDCIARNRAAIVDPWREYRREGNSYFLFLLSVMLGAMVFFGLLCLFGFFAFGIFDQHDISPAMTPLFIIFLALFFIFW